MIKTTGFGEEGRLIRPSLFISGRSATTTTTTTPPSPSLLSFTIQHQQQQHHHHHHHPPPPPPPPTTQQQQQQCPHCLKMLSSRQSLLRHIEDRHMLTQPYRCSICGSLCKTKNALQKHHYTYHRGLPLRIL
ncbi:Protein abrupt [Portunus trituberculatus]|uniref:Protein abrupt n=1 Tax=Portunus trituberculatus TaxID=210409 RepID=A0A5B7EA53_PORTR|nr:Protein abrupt [Portunus trituberculatus]